MGFRKYEVLVRKNSDANIDDVIKMFKEGIDEKQASDPETLWAASVFDLRTLKEYMIFSDKSAETFNITDVYKTADGTLVPGVMNLGQKIMDVDKTIKEGIEKNSNTILDIVKSNFNQFNDLIVNMVPQPELPEDLQEKLDQIDQINEIVNNLEKIKEEFNIKINDIENQLEIELPTIIDNIKKLQVEMENLNVDTIKEEVKTEVENEVKEVVENEIKEIEDKIIDPEVIQNLSQQLNDLLALKDKITELETKLNNINLTADYGIADNEVEDILSKLANDEDLTDEEKQELEKILSTTQGYVL